MNRNWFLAISSVIFSVFGCLVFVIAIDLMLSKVNLTFESKNSVLKMPVLSGVHACRLSTNIATKAIYHHETFDWSNGGDEKTIKYDYKGPAQPQKQKGPQLHSPGTYSFKMTDIRNNQVIFDFVSHIGAQSRRDVPAENSESRPFHALVMGCSHAVGHGLAENDFLPAQIGQIATSYLPISLAHGGFGPVDILSWIRHYHGLEGIEPQRGIAIYQYFHSHLGRTSGAIPEAYWTGWANIDSSIDEKGDIQALESFAQTRPFWTFLGTLIMRSQLRRIFNLEWPPSNWAIPQTVRAIVAIREEYYHHFPKTNPFLVEILPKIHPTNSEFIAELEKAHIPYLDYSQYSMEQIAERPPYIPLDGHYNRDGIHALSMQIVEDLRLNSRTPEQVLADLNPDCMPRP